MSRVKEFLLIGIVPILLIATSCHNESSDNKAIYDTDSTKTTVERVRKAKSIFYQMYLPSEMYKIFEKAGAVYNPDILNPVENVNLYETSAKAALNMGIYGVDLSYNKMFGQNQKTLLYFSVIHKLSQQLGIPDNQFAIAIKRMEKNISNRDSLSKYAMDIYVSANHFLNENDRQAISAMIIVGGWIEALYIATKVADDNVSNQEIVERIAFQKYSLRTLISLLSNYQSDPNITKYILMLKALDKTFSKFEIYYEKGDVSIDTLNKLINAHKIDFTVDQTDLKGIKSIVAQIRKDMVN
jgi:hypothetical protein